MLKRADGAMRENPPSRTIGQLPDGRAVTEYTLARGEGPALRVLDLGATVAGFRLDPNDPTSEVVVGFGTLKARLEAASAYFGAVVGRYANRIAGAEVEIDGRTHRLTANQGTTTLHGGAEGFDSRVWEVVEAASGRLVLRLVSPDGDQGFPGELTATATYTLLDDGFALDLAATTGAPTLAWLTSHLYLNLAGGGTAEDHLLTVDADSYVPVDERSIPLGRLDPVAGTAFDLTKPTRVAGPVRADDPQIALARGIDHSFQLRGSGLRRAARLEDPASGRSMELLTDAPALQVYTGNFLDGSWVAAGGRLRQGDAVALEPHQHPDAPHQPWVPDAILRPGQTWRARLEWRFAW